MLATKTPLGVVPSAPRFPSWKIHTIAPKAAVSERTLSAKAFSGITTLPVNRKRSMNMKLAISPSTKGKCDAMALTLSRLIWAVPVKLTSSPPGSRDRVQAVELSFGAVGEQRSGAVDGEERAALLLSGRR